MKFKHIITTSIIATVTALSCNTDPTPSPQVTHMPAKITDSDICPQACANMVKLKCPEGEPIDTHFSCVTDANCQSGEFCADGTCHASCETFCRNTQGQGVWLSPGCVAKVTSCAQIDLCP